jgi:hypothetical protein
MARSPNYEFERRERDRLKAAKVAQKAAAKREERERNRTGETPSDAPASEPEDK